MAYNDHQNGPQLGATFVPGGFDDFYIPAAPELISPAPQRFMPEVPEQMQDSLAHLELEANETRHSQYGYQDPSQSRQRQSSLPQVQNHQRQSASYTTLAPPTQDLPNFSPFPKLQNLGPHVPPSDEQKLDIIESARQPVLNSNDPEMQLAWAQDALTYVTITQTYDERCKDLDDKPPKTSGAAIEQQIKSDAMSIVDFLAQQQHPRAQFMKGTWLESGLLGVREDKREAFRYYARSADKGYSRAFYRMGLQFEQSGEPIRAIENYQRGVAAGDAASNYRLGMASLNGQLGQQADFGKAVQMLRAAAQEADENAPQGAYVLGMLQARQLPQVQVQEVLLPYDQQAARDNIAKSAYLGFAKAQVKMGAAYELCDLGCEFDPALSLHYNALAARQGDQDAEMAISKWFLCGHEGLFKKNDELAYVYANRAASTGLATAEFAMGYFYEIGLYVPTDVVKAKSWYEKAAGKGNPDAKSRIEGLNHSQKLSKKDHENVAIERIKSQYGSKRGGRPPRFSQSQAPPMPTISDEHGNQQPHGAGTQQMNLPPRGSSRTPYPADDGPPKITLPERPATVAPYPMDDAPPQIRPLRTSLAGGFAPELGPPGNDPRRVSGGNAFGINPSIYQDGGRLGASTQSLPQQQHNALPSRPATTIANMGPSQPNSRLSTQSANSRPPSGQHDPSRPPRFSSQQILTGGSPAPQNPNRPSPMMSGANRPQSHTPQPTMNDLGYIAPLQVKPRPQPHNPNDPNSSSQPRPQVSPSLRPQSNVHPRIPSGGPPNLQSNPRPTSAQPQSRPNTLQNHASAPNLGAPAVSSGKPGRPTVPGTTIDSGLRPIHQQGPKPTPHPSLAPQKKPSGNGPKTFEQMGVPQAQKESDCIIM